MKQLAAEAVRELGEADLVLLASERGIKAPEIKALRDRHHALARCLAQGMSEGEASMVTGYSLSRISILKGDQSFKQLVSHYQQVKESAFADFQDRASQLALTAVDVMLERIEDAPEDVTFGQLHEVAKTFADRTGHAPVQRSVNVQANVDLGDKLAAARRRLQAARQEVIVASTPIEEAFPSPHADPPPLD